MRHLLLFAAGWGDAQLYFWSIQGRHEVDFVIEAENKCIAIEVKASARWTDKDLSGLKAFLSQTSHCIAAVLAYNGTEAVRLGDRMWALPLSVLLSCGLFKNKKVRYFLMY